MTTPDRRVRHQFAGGVPSTTRSARSHGRSAAKNGSSSVIQSSQNASASSGVRVPYDASRTRPRARASGAVRLHPDHQVRQPGQLGTADAAPLDDERPPAGRLDGPRPVVRLPPRRPVAHVATAAPGADHAADEQVVPAEPGVLPGDVVGVHQAGAEQAGETAGERGLAAATPSVDQHQRRPPDEREQLGVVDRPPRSEVRLLRVQVHALSRSAARTARGAAGACGSGCPSSSTFTSTTRDRAITALAVADLGLERHRGPTHGRDPRPHVVRLRPQVHLPDVVHLAAHDDHVDGAGDPRLLEDAGHHLDLRLVHVVEVPHVVDVAEQVDVGEAHLDRAAVRRPRSTPRAARGARRRTAARRTSSPAAPARRP